MHESSNPAPEPFPAADHPAREEDRVRALAEAQRIASIGSWEFDIVADRMTWSDELYAVMGVSKQDFAPSYEGFIALVDADHRERVRSTVGAALDDHAPFSYDFKRVRDGAVRVLHARGEVRLSEDGRAIAMFGTVQDVTALREAQERLRETEERYRALVERLPAITYIAQAGGEGRWHFVSPQIERMLGYSVEEWQADPDLWLASVHPADRERVEAEEKRCEENGNALCIEYRMVARDGRVLWVRDEAVVTTGDSHGSPGPVFEGLLTEITERKTLEEQLRHHADHDALTGLVNRRRFEFELRRQVTHAARYATRGALLIVDIDHFKGINDSVGHAVGDEVLKMTANALQERLRESDVLARLGGDEFAVLLVGAQGDHVAPPGPLGPVSGRGAAS